MLETQYQIAEYTQLNITVHTKIAVHISVDHITAIHTIVIHTAVIHINVTVETYQVLHVKGENGQCQSVEIAVVEI